jgi:hypothetical protein
MKNRTVLGRFFANSIIVMGLFLLAINLYGLNRQLEPVMNEGTTFRFANDVSLTFDQAIQHTDKRSSESDIEYAVRITSLVSARLAHIEWELPSNPDQYHQRVPIWENYFLYFMGVVTTIPEYHRYHFADYKRSLERGIGICGDASMILSQLLTEHNIDNKILTFPGHVVVVANFQNGEQYILDPDFGVVVPYSLKNLKMNSADIAKLYVNAGYTQGDYRFFDAMFKQDFVSWNGVKHFITNKYYFEKIAYWLKWPLPVFMVLMGLFLLRKPKVTSSKAN